MRKDWSWATDVKYLIQYSGDREDMYREKKACYSKFSTPLFRDAVSITLYNTSMVKTVQYRKEYLQYLADMLQLEEVEITDEYFKYKPLSGCYNNMLVASLTRYLWESFGTIEPELELGEMFIKPLLEGTDCKYEDKLARFCYYYSKIEVPSKHKPYMHEGHTWKPHNTKIKTTQDWIRLRDGLSGVNEFFTT